MIHLVSFATPPFYQSLNTLVKSAQKFHIDKIHPFTDADLKKTDFYRTHRIILDQPRGAGYWLWKPFYLLEILKAASPGDVVIYSDAGIELVSSPDPLVSLAKKHNSLLFWEGGENLNFTYTKRDCFILTNADNKNYWQAPQVLGSFHLHLVTPKTIDFISRWLGFCSNPYILTDLPNICGKNNLPGYLDHRHDQSVLSILTHRDHYPLFRDPSQNARHLLSKTRYKTSSYGIILDHHRRHRLAVKQRLLSRLHI